MQFNPRSTVNKPGVVYDATKLSTIFQEDFDTLYAILYAAAGALKTDFSVPLSLSGYTGGDGFVDMTAGLPDYDYGLNYDGHAGGFVAPYSGTFHFHCKIFAQYDGSGESFGRLALTINGATVRQVFAKTVDNGCFIEFNEDIQLSQGDVAWVQFTGDGSDTWSFNTIAFDTSRFSCYGRQELVL